MLTHWGRGKRFVKAREGLAIWIKRQQEMKANIRAKGEFEMKGPAINVDRILRDRLLPDDVRHTDSKHPLADGRSYGNFLQKKGFMYIGSGAYSTVYKHPKDTKGRCIKVSRRMDPWFEYIHWAYENGYTEYCPGVHSYKYHPGKSVDERYRQPFYVAIVDQLTTNNSGEHEMTGYFFQHLMHSKVSEKTKMLAELNSPGFVTFVEAFSKRFYKDGEKRHGYSLDCYGANTMLSICGKRWILNDPLCGEPKNDNIVQRRWRNDTRRSGSVSAANTRNNLLPDLDNNRPVLGDNLAQAA